MLTIAFFELEKWETDYLENAMSTVDRQFLNGIKLRFSENRLCGENVKDCADVNVINVFVFSQITKKVIDSMPALRHINTMSTGFDHIDLAACAKRGITVSNVPSYGENTVAEHAFALLLALSRRIVPSVLQTRRGNFSTGPELRGFDLKDKTLGVVGTGKIGKHIIRMARGFGMNVVAFDLYPDIRAANELGYAYLSTLEEVMSKSDALTLHCLLTPQTAHMINRGNITRMKKGCVLINTARGGLIETEAILLGLEEGIISAAGLDVIEGEVDIKEEKMLVHKGFDKADLKTMLQEHMLIEYDNIIMTPHNAFNSEEALKRILDTTVDNVKAFIAQKPINIVKAV